MRGPWLGYTVGECTLLFVCAEDDEEELHRRIAAIATSLDVSLSEMARLHSVPLAGRDAVMGIALNKTGLVTATSVFRGLVRLVERLRPGIIVLDALADVFGGRRTPGRRRGNSSACCAASRSTTVLQSS